MSEPLVSVILPVYNAVSYVGDAIDSLMNQDFDDFEIIIVDDGSSDGSGSVCDEKALLDSRIKVFHQNNKGISGARNKAIAESSGKYIAFCDHDDLYEKNFLSKVIGYAEKNGAELLKYSYRTEVCYEGKVTDIYENKLPDKAFSVTELAENYTCFARTVKAIWNGVYLGSVIRKNNLKFDESIKAGIEDYLFNTEVLKLVSKVDMLSDTLYHHFVRYGQSTFEKYNEKRLADIARAAENEKALLMGLIKTDSCTWISHQSVFVRLYLRTLLNPDSNLAAGEKKRRLKKLSKNEMKLVCPKSKYLEALKKRPGDAVISILFTFGFLNSLMSAYSRHRKKQMH